ncbi:MAG TPA: ChbG/HpnK family deacetylase [Clostridia bacterium]|nr:ChbG/HpnK family deacetylase [Clostridia bacterium]
MRRLVVNADDFGLTRGVNRAIIECHRQGIVTSATLMACGAAFDDAVALARQNPALGIGCHVVLLDGRPLLPAERVRTLLSPRDEFFRSIGEFAPRAMMHRFSAKEIEAEAVAQFEKIRAAGIAITHFDAHKHAHMFPSVLEPLLKAAKRCGIGAVRNPFERPILLPSPRVLTRASLAVRYAEVLALRSFRKQFLRLVRKHGLATTDGSIGVVATGELDQDILREMLERIPEGTWELVCHPGYNDAELATVPTKLRASRETELQALTSAGIRDALHARQVERIAFGRTNAPVALT